MKRQMFPVTDYGAVPDSDGFQTKAFQDAIDACFLAGGGEVQVPAGVYRIGGIRLRSRVTLHLLSHAVLKGSRDSEDYFAWKNDRLEPFEKEVCTDAVWTLGDSPVGQEQDFFKYGSRWNNALIRAYHADQIAVIGESDSILDGSDCYDEMGEEYYRGPHGMTFDSCHNITLCGYTIQHTGNWAHNLRFCQDILMDGVTTLGGHDGIHVSSCDNIIVRNTEFYTGDDCVAGFDNTNLTVSSCVLNTACSAMRFGGTNAVIEDCHIFAPAHYFFRGSLSPEEKRTNILTEKEHRFNMLSVFTYYADFSLKVRRQPDNIVIRRCKVENADRFIHYNFSGNERWQAGVPLRSVCFEDIDAEGIAMPLTMYGSADVPLFADFTRIHIKMREGSEHVSLMHLCHYERITFRHVSVEGTQADPLIQVWSEDGEILFHDFRCDLPHEQYVKKAEQPFQCSPI